MTSALQHAREAGIALTTHDLQRCRPTVPEESNMALRLDAAAESIGSWRSCGGEGPEPEASRLARLTRGPFRELRLTLGSEDLLEIRAFVADENGSLSAIHDAARLETGVYPVSWGDTLWDTGFPFLERHERVAGGLRIACLDALEEGNSALASQWIGDALRINVCLAHEPFGVPIVRSLCLDQEAIYVLELALASCSFNDPELAYLQKSVRAVPSRYDTRRLLESICSWTYEAADAFVSGRQVASGPTALEDPPGWLWAWSYRLSPGRREFERAALLSRWTEDSQNWSASLGKVFRWCRAREEDPYPLGEDNVLGLAGGGIYWAMRMAMSTLIETVALSRAADAALAAKRYRLTHGSWPQELSDMVPEFLDAVPRDPFGEEPMRYRQDENGVRIWSVGADLTDDAGQVASEVDGTEPADVGFRLLER